MIMQLRKVPAAGTRIKVEECGLVTLWNVDGKEEIQFWLHQASDEELVNIILFYKDEIHNRLVENRVEIFKCLKVINGELDNRVNVIACGSGFQVSGL